MKRKFQAVKGTRDILPPESALWNRVEHIARQTFSAYNFHEIRPPMFEDTELFARSVGANTDIVSKEMYTFEGDPPQILTMADLEFTKRPIVMADPETMRAYLDGYRALVVKLEQAVEKGDLLPTEENIGTVQRLRSVLEKEPPGFNDLEPSERNQWLALMASGGMLTLAGEMPENINALLRGPSLSLRPEATAQVCRAYIEHGMHTWPSPVKLYYIGPMFRRERPQKGRFRQFYQIGAEVLGPSDHPAIDAEVIELVMVFLERCGLTGAALYVNSIGCLECRPKYVELLRKELQKVKDKLGPDSQRRIETNPLRVLDSKLEAEQPVIAKLPSILDHLCDACRHHFGQLRLELRDRGIKYEINPRLVRGLDYYVRTTFEITAPGLGAQNAVCGGGRYDGLVELLGGPPTKGIGWALGTDRLVMGLRALGMEPEDWRQFDVVVTGTTEATWAKANEVASALRRNGLSVYLPPSNTPLGKALETGNRFGARVAIIIGEDELKQERFAVRVLRPFTELVEPPLVRPRDTTVSTGDVATYGQLVKLRADLERELKRWASGPGLVGASLSTVVSYLINKRLLPMKLGSALQDVIPTLNAAVHLEAMDEDSLMWALAFGNLVLEELRKLTPPEQKHEA